MQTSKLLLAFDVAVVVVVRNWMGAGKAAAAVVAAVVMMVVVVAVAAGIETFSAGAAVVGRSGKAYILD